MNTELTAGNLIRIGKRYAIVLNLNRDPKHPRTIFLTLRSIWVDRGTKSYLLASFADRSKNRTF